ncbi:hypothetical protein [Arsukibacterium sp.]
MRDFWKKHKKKFAILAAAIGTPLAGALFVVTDTALTEPVQQVQTQKHE